NAKRDAGGRTRGAVKDTADDKDTVVCSGRVIDPDGKPVAGAKVHFVRRATMEATRSSAGGGPTATTDAEGGFQFHVAGTGFGNEEEELHGFNATITAVHAAWGPGWVAITKAEALKDVTVKLVKDDVPVQGRVVDLEGLPIAGVTVRIKRFAANESEDLKLWVDDLQNKKEVFSNHHPRTVLHPDCVGLTKPVVTGTDGELRLTGIGRERIVTLCLEGPTIDTRYVNAMTRPGATIRVSPEKIPPFPGKKPDLDRGADGSYYGASFVHAAAPTRPITGTVVDKDTGRP